MSRTASYLAVAIVVALLAAVPLLLGRYNNYVFSLWLVTAIAAMGVNLIMGYAGQETLAQAGFMGVGAYLTALMIKGGKVVFPVIGLVEWAPFHLFTAIACAGLLTFLLGIVIGFPALRVQKHYLAFVTLAFTVFIWLVLRNEEWLTGGVFGIQDIKRPDILGVPMSPSRRHFANYSWLVLIVTLILTALMWWLVKSPWGRAFTALRENPIRAESLGINVRLYTLLAFAIGSAYGGFAGALYAPLVEFIDPAPFSLAPSLMFLLMIVVGGMGSFFGPFIGAAVAVILPLWIETLQSQAVQAGYTSLSHISYVMIFGLLVILMIAFMPKGIAGLAERFRRSKQGKAPDALAQAQKGAAS